MRRIKLEDLFLHKHNKLRHTRGYILPTVVILSIVILSAVAITMQIISSSSKTLEAQIKRGGAQEIAEEQLKRTLQCANSAASHEGCSTSNIDTQKINDQNSKTTTTFSANSNKVTVSTTTTVGNFSFNSEKATIKAQFQRDNIDFLAQNIDEPSLDDSEKIDEVSAGGYHSCAKTTLGKLHCWGSGGQGQIGTGTYTSINRRPTHVASLSSVKSVDAGLYHTCAIAGSNNALYCWGSNTHGQLGTGNVTPKNTPGSATIATGVRQVTAGAYHTCAVTLTNKLFCWGNNSAAQIGRGYRSASNILSPTEVTHANVVDNVLQVSAGAAHTCVVRQSNRAVYCWGLSEQGAAGGYGINSSVLTPILIDGGFTYKMVSAGHWHTCGITNGDRLRCWGYNHNGQLGASRPLLNLFGPAYTNTPPGTVNSLSSYAHNCASSTIGEVYCWGNPSEYRLGNSGNNVWTPFKVPALRLSSGVATGDQHSCAITNGGKDVRCWGQNNYGQLGDGTSGSPTGSPRLANIALNPGLYSNSLSSTQFSGGDRHSCSISYEQVFCMGQAHFGRLGIGLPAGSTELRRTPSLVSTLPKGSVTEVSTGYEHSCALMTTGSIRCWGRNYDGQLGDSTTIDRTTPTPVSLGAGEKAVQVSAGYIHTCALLDTGTIKCWGSAVAGRLGNNTSSGRSLVPVTVNAPGVKFVKISSQGSHSCGIVTNGSLMCWGFNGSGQVGNNSTSSVLRPVTINTGGIQVQQVSTGLDHTCALLTNGTVRCWGRNISGQIGDGTNIERRIPTSVTSLGGQVAQIQTGASHTCALLTNGTVRCWGHNAFGQLGDGTNTDRYTPATAVNFNGAIPVKLSLGYYHSCVILQNSSTVCWGASGFGQRGSGDLTDTTTPTSIKPPIRTFLSTISAGSNHTCGINRNSKLFCWGRNYAGQLGDGSTISRNQPTATADTSEDFIQVSGGANHTCAVQGSGQVRCWGQNTFGQLGNGSGSSSTIPVAVTLGSGDRATQVATGSNHSCAVLESGQIRCWGRNNFGQLGNGGSSSSSFSPVTVTLAQGERAVQLSAGDNFTCALLESGAVKCWGQNNYRQLDDGSTTNRLTPVPTASYPDDRALQISSGTHHSCVLLDTGEVKCWGNNSYGQLATGSTAVTTGRVSVPLNPTEKATQVTAGGSSSCLILTTGKGRCWGLNNMGQAGTGDTNSPLLTPTNIQIDTEDILTQLSSSGNHTCATLKNDQVKCWGNNSHGQIGINSTVSPQTRPVKSFINQINYLNYVIY